MPDLDSGLIPRFIFTVTLLGVFIILVGLMATESPTLFISAETDYDSLLPPNYLTDILSAEEIRTLVFWGTYNISRGSGGTLTITRTGDMPNIDIEINWMNPISNIENFICRRYWYEWGGLVRENRDVLPKYPQNPIFSPPWMCESDFFYSDNLDDSGNFSRILMYDDAFNYVMFVTYDESTYSSLSDAFTNGELTLSLGMGWEYESSVMSGWDLISRLLVFQAPNIHPIVNAIIAIPIIATVSIVIFGIAISIVKALPFT